MWIEVVSVFALFVAAMGLVALAAPKVFLDKLTAFDLPSKVWMLAAIRIGLGLSLWFVAPETHHPNVFRFFGILTITAGVAIPILGSDGMAKLVDWWKMRPPAALRAWGVVAMGFAIFLLWSMYGG